MSRAYNMSITIGGFHTDRGDAIVEAASQEWPFADWWGGGDLDSELHASAESSLCGGEGEEEFADRLARAVWEANGGFCEVTVDATYLESLPFETHWRDEDDYERLVGQPVPRAGQL
jgi:hypothetical protein